MMNTILDFLFGKRAFQWSDFMEYDQIGFRTPHMRNYWFIIYRADVHMYIPSKGNIFFGFGPLFKTEKECQSAIDKIGRKNLFSLLNP